MICGPRVTPFAFPFFCGQVREKIASCAEKAYESFPVKEVGQLLLLSDAKQVNAATPTLCEHR